MSVTPTGFLQQLHYGGRAGEKDLAYFSVLADMSTPADDINMDMAFNDMPSEYGFYARGDYKEPSAIFERRDGASMSRLHYVSYRIEKGAPNIQGMPHVRKGDETLVITLKDDFSDIAVDLYYTVSDDSNVLVRNAVARNTGTEEITLKKVFSFRAELPNTEKTHYDKMLRLHKLFPNRIAFAGGAWSWIGFTPANEFAIRSSEVALQSCIEQEIEEIFITCWKDDGAESSLYSVLPSLMCVAEFANGNFDREKIAEKFYRIVGVNMSDFLALDNVNLVKAEMGFPCNPSKYMLYSDPFLGIFDYTVSEGDGKKFIDIRDSLLMVCDNENFGYLFRTIAELCDVLNLKYDLGVRTRRAYSMKDKKELNRLIEDYSELARSIERFYRSFCTQWDKECKPYGFEKHDIRLGGLICRINHCLNMLKQYLDGSINLIAPLEEDILSVSDGTVVRPILFNDWLSTAMIKSSS